MLKAEFKDASLSTLKSAAQTLLRAFAKKQIAKYLDLQFHSTVSYPRKRRSDVSLP